MPVEMGMWRLDGDAPRRLSVSIQGVCTGNGVTGRRQAGVSARKVRL